MSMPTLACFVGRGVQLKLHTVQMHVGSWGEFRRTVGASEPHHGHLAQTGVLTGTVNAAHGNMKIWGSQYI